MSSTAARSLTVLGVLMACGPCGEQAEPPEAEVAETSTEEPGAEVMPENEAPQEVVYDLGAHRTRARLRDGDALVFDFGGPRGAQTTLGGWRTRTGASHRFGDVDALLIEGLIGEVALPAESSRASTLFVRARTFGLQGRLTVYLGERAIAHPRLPRDGSFETIRIELPEDSLAVGENVVQFRVPERGRDDGVRAGLALDWIRLGRASEMSASPPPSMGDALPEGWSLAWPVEISVGDTLSAEVEGEVRVMLRQDGVRPQNLGVHSGSIEIDLPVAEFAELEIRAENGRARIVSAEIRRDQAERAVAPAPSAPRNVIVFLVDTVRADKLRPFNPETRVRTPALDTWAARSSVFTQARTQENWTKPSVATLLTGLYPWQHRAASDAAVLPNSVETLSERLQDSGFHTGAFICNGYVSGAFGFRQGWSSWRNYIREGRRTQARFVAADVLEWLDARPEEKPFFLYVHTIDPHVPYIPPPELLAEYDPEPYQGPIDFTVDRGLLEKIKSGALRTNARDRVRLEALYDGEITYHDTHFGSILDGLDRRGLMDETLIVFTADHGEEFFDHESVGHGHSLFEELLHVPFILYLPGATPTRVDEPARLQDVVPTVLDALGQDADDELPGRSLLGALRGERSAAPVPSVAGFMEGWRALIYGRYKLIQRTHRTAMVYDLVADPQEHHDLSAERPLLLRSLRAMLGLVLAGQGGAVHEAQTTVIDAETEAQLEALGYVGVDRPN